MKHIIIFIITILLFNTSKAGIFFLSSGDTVFMTVTSINTTLHHNFGVPNSDTAGVRVAYQVVSTDFPSDWIANTGFGFRLGLGISKTMSSLWPSRSMDTTDLVNPGSSSLFYLSFGGRSTTTAGTHYATVRMIDIVNLDTFTKIFAVQFIPPSSVETVVRENSIQLGIFPIPARDALFVSEPSVSFVEIFDVNGSIVVARQNITTQQRKITLPALKPGNYIIRGRDGDGAIIGTDKFVVIE